MEVNKVLNQDIRDDIRGYFARYPTKQAALLPALHIVSERMGYVPKEAVVEIAELLELEPAEVQ
ncbi:MAG: NAD(P)H-dependent oxidoreductase subunit E, partial [Thermoguttaceae bacterium]